MKKATLTVPEPCGGMIYDYAKMLVNLRDLCHARMGLHLMVVETEVTGCFNGISLVCDKTATADSITTHYNAASERRYRATHGTQVVQPAAIG